MHAVNWPSSYLRLPANVALKCLEQPFVYHIGRDELYEVDTRAKDFLTQCDGTRRGSELTADADFVAYCLAEGLLELLAHPEPLPATVNQPVSPSLRYLELQLLHRCNLRCLHCYIGSGESTEMALTDAVNLVREFSALGGLRLMISGGEPLLYKDLERFIAQTADLKVRRVLLTNGMLLNTGNADRFRVEEIQFSLDGWAEGHDMLRGAGAFAATIRGIYAAKEAGITISCATMIHQGNIHEFEQIGDFLEKIGAIEWGIDMPVPAGSLEDHRHVLVPYEEAVPLMKYAYGGGYHGSADGYACGRHLLTVLPTGQAVKCGFYRETPVGDTRRGLKQCWLQLEHIPLSSLACHDCPVIQECAGGCRFRAPQPLAPDPFMCALYGVAK